MKEIEGRRERDGKKKEKMRKEEAWRAAVRCHQKHFEGRSASCEIEHSGVRRGKKVVSREKREEGSRLRNKVWLQVF